MRSSSVHVTNLGENRGPLSQGFKPSRGWEGNQNTPYKRYGGAVEEAQWAQVSPLSPLSLSARRALPAAGHDLAVPRAVGVLGVVAVPVVEVRDPERLLAVGGRVIRTPPIIFNSCFSIWSIIWGG